MSRPAQLPGTPRLLRALNDRAALELLLTRGPLTRAQLGELTGLSKVTASQLVERLEERGLVARVGEQAGGRGPNASLYAVVPTSAFVVGVDGGPELAVAACADITGQVLGRVEQSTHDSDDPVGVVHKAVIEAAHSARAPLAKVRRVVLGSPGLVDPTTGDVSFVFDLPLWQRGLLAALRDDLKRAVVFENDVNLGAVAEPPTGAARGVDDFVLLWLDRGVGRSVGLGGRLHRGVSGAAGEIGYLPVAGAPVPRGGRAKGGFKELAVAAAIRAVAREHGFRAATAQDAVRAAVNAGTPGAPVLDELARRLALGLAAACVVLDPALVVLAGEVGLAGGLSLAHRVQLEVAAIAPVSPRVVVSEAVSEPGLHGPPPAGRDPTPDGGAGTTPAP